MGWDFEFSIKRGKAWLRWVIGVRFGDPTTVVVRGGTCDSPGEYATALYEVRDVFHCVGKRKPS